MSLARVVCAPFRSLPVRFIMDVIYVVATLLFFALMLVFVRGCERLGRSADVDRASGEAR